MTVPAEPDLTAGAPAPVADPPAAPPAELDLESELEERTYTKAEMQAVRQEAAGRRVSERELKQKLDALHEGLDDGDAEYLLGIARKLRDDPKSTAAEFRALSERIEAALEETDPAPAADPDAADKPLTRADLEQIEKERAIAAAQVALTAEAKALNERYVDGNPEYAQLLWYATHDKDCKGSLQKAHDKLVLRDEGLRQAAVDAYVKGVQETAGAFPPVGAPGGNGPSSGAPAGGPKTWAEASDSALARLQARQG